MATSLVVGLPCEIISALYYTLNAVRVHEKLCCAMWEYNMWAYLQVGPVSFGNFDGTIILSRGVAEVPLMYAFLHMYIRRFIPY